MDDQSLFPTRKAVGMMQLVDPAAVAAAEAAKSQIQAAYIVAMQKPRNQMQARTNILMACRRTEFAEKAEYSKPIGNTKITGPSVRFAELAIREWENVRVETVVLYEDDDVKRLRVSAIDLETNAQFSRDIQIKKTIERKSKKGREGDIITERKNTFGHIVYVLRATDDEMLTKESAWVSKIIRNEGLRLIPTDIIEEGLKQARETLQSRAAMDPDGEKKKIVDAFAGIGIKPVQIEKYLGHEIGTIGPAEIAELRSIYRTIRDGEATWNDYIKTNDQTDNGGKEQDPNDDVADSMKDRKGPSLYGGKNDSQQSKPTGASRYSGANSRPPEGYFDQNASAKPDPAGQPGSENGQASGSTDWDPRTEPLMGKYYADKRDAVMKAADEMGIPTDGRTPKDVHADIQALHNQTEGQDLNEQGNPTAKQDNKQVNQPSIRDQFLQVLAERGIADEEIGDINAYVHHVVTETKSSPQKVMVGAMKNPAEFIKWYRDWKKKQAAMHGADDARQDDAGDGERKQVMDDLRDQLISLSHGEKAEKYKSIVNTMFNAGALPSTFADEWTEDQCYQVIDAVNEQF